MNPELKSDKDLKALLSQWRPEGSLPPRFAESVWRRIEAVEPAPTLWQIAKNWVERSFARPAIAFSYCAVLTAIGLGFGSWRSQEQSAHTQSQLEARYVQAISPYHKGHQ